MQETFPPKCLQCVRTEVEAGRKSCLPVPVGVAQPASYWLLISRLWRPGEREEEKCLKVCEAYPYGDEYSVPLAFLHTGFHYSIHTHTRTLIQTCAYSSHIHWLLFSLWIIYFIHLCHPCLSQDRSLVCRLRPLFVQNETESHPGRFIFLGYSSMPSSSAGNVPQT